MRFGQVQAVGDALFAIDDQGELWRHSKPAGELNDADAVDTFVSGWERIPHPDYKAEEPEPAPKPPLRALPSRGGGRQLRAGKR